MNLQGIISISGKSGLFKVVAQGKNSVIVESISDKKRIPAQTTNRISALEDISVYTYDGDIPLAEVFSSIYKKTEGQETISHKENASKLKDLLLEVVPNYDEERVYVSDIKKIISWYNILQKCGNLELVEPEEEDTEKEK